MPKRGYPSSAPTIDTMSASDHPHTSAEPPPKSTLFCPDCGHESDATGDWTVSEETAETVISCPDCGTEIATWSQSRGLCFAD